MVSHESNAEVPDVATALSVSVYGHERIIIIDVHLDGWTRFDAFFAPLVVQLAFV